MWKRIETNLYLALAWLTLPRAQYIRYRDSIRSLDREIAHLKRLRSERKH